MKKQLFIALGAVALLTLVGNSTVFAAECDSTKLPNDRFSFDKRTTTSVSPLFYNPGAPNNTNLFTKIITATRCVALNPGGEEVARFSYDLETSEGENILVCNQINGLTPTGAELGFTEAYCQAPTN